MGRKGAKEREGTSPYTHACECGGGEADRHGAGGGLWGVRTTTQPKAQEADTKKEALSPVLREGTR